LPLPHPLLNGALHPRLNQPIPAGGGRPKGLLPPAFGCQTCRGCSPDMHPDIAQASSARPVPGPAAPRLHLNGGPAWPSGSA
jgi:hypothetical protein